MKDKIIAPLLPALRYWWSIAIGGAAGAAENYVQQVGLTINTAQVDWHKIGQVALLGAFMAVVFHAVPPPNRPQPKQPEPPQS